MEAEFKPEAIASLDDETRPARLRALETALTARLPSDASAREFFMQSQMLVEELRSLGHDLWSFDTDGEEFEIWCGDWTRAGGGGPMTITFRYPRQVEVTWRDETRGAG